MFQVYQLKDERYTIIVNNNQSTSDFDICELLGISSGSYRSTMVMYFKSLGENSWDPISQVYFKTKQDADRAKQWVEARYNSYFVEGNNN